MPIRRALQVVPLAALLAALAACGDASVSDDGPPVSGASGGTPPVLVVAEGGGNEPGITVGEALGHQATDDLVTVTGSLLVDADGTVMLCEALAESFPPQCGGERLVIDGLDPSAVAGLQTEGDISWSDSVTLFGSVE